MLPRSCSAWYFTSDHRQHSSVRSITEEGFGCGQMELERWRLVGSVAGAGTERSSPAGDVGACAGQGQVVVSPGEAQSSGVPMSQVHRNYPAVDSCGNVALQGCSAV